MLGEWWANGGQMSSPLLMTTTRSAVHAAGMDRQAALARLPDRYRDLLTMVDAGGSVEEISEALGLDVDAIPPLVEVGRAKLAGVLDPSPPHRVVGP